MTRSIRKFGATILGITTLYLLAASALADTPDPVVPDAALTPVAISVLASSHHAERGLIFVTPTSAAAGAAHGAQIVDGGGRPVWFKQLPAGENAFDLRVQEYRHEPVLTWIESKGQFSTGPTTGYIADRHYRVIATVNASNGLTSDIHELHLTREGTALVPSYRTVTRDLSSVGGATSGLVTEGVVQEIEIATGRVLFEWHSLDHIGLDESHAAVPSSGATPWDYFHLNAINVDEDGNLLVNARHTWAAYRIDRRTGAVKWRLGGKKSDFALGENVAFAWQHNAVAVDHRGLIRIFDNEASPQVLPYSRVIWVRHDDEKKTVTLERWFKHPENLLAGSQGNAQGLENGDTFVGWGALPRISELDERGGLVFDASFPAGYNTYRAYRFEWRGEPDTRPTAIATRTTNGDTAVRAIWNGATEVVEWDVLDRSGHHAREVESAAWNGIDTPITVHEYLHSVVVVARDRHGREIGRSAVTPVAE